MLLLEIIKFYKSLLWHYLAPDTLRNVTPDAQHCHRRRFTPQYLRKKRLVKSLWLGALTIGVLFQSPPLIFIIALFMTFLSFLILDETT